MTKSIQPSYRVETGRLVCPHRMLFLDQSITIALLDRGQASLFVRFQEHPLATEPSDGPLSVELVPHLMASRPQWVKYAGIGWMQNPSIYQVVNRYYSALELSAAYLFGSEMVRQMERRGSPRHPMPHCLSRPQDFLFDVYAIYASFVKNPHTTEYELPWASAMAHLEIMQEVLNNPGRAPEIAEVICEAIEINFTRE